MNIIANIINAFRAAAIPEAQLRAEAWALGGRHRGEVIDGARTELRAPGISPGRIRLLHAVIQRETARNA